MSRWWMLAVAALMGCDGAVEPAAPAPGNPGGKADIYGADGRLELFEVPAASPMRDWARSTGLIVLDDAPAIESLATGGFGLAAEVEDLGQRFDLCSDEPFVAQPSVPNCTVFLVAPDVVATAGHCLDTCDDNLIVFDYGYADGPPMNPFQDIQLPDDDVYTCKHVIEHHFTGFADFNSDYALLRLDRPVVGREPLSYSESTDDLTTGDALTIVGHPSGLPTKVSVDALTGFSQGRLKSQNDVFRGSSGSPVIDDDGVVQAIFVVLRNGGGYVASAGQSCKRGVVCGVTGQCFPPTHEPMSKVAPVLDALTGKTHIDLVETGAHIDETVTGIRYFEIEIAPGAAELRVEATSDQTEPRISLRHGELATRHRHDASGLSSASQDQPAAGTWSIAVDPRGGSEIAVDVTVFE